MKVIYQAIDGKEFDTETECMEHETDTALYYNIVNNMSYGGRGRGDEITERHVEVYIRDHIHEINKILGFRAV